MLLMASMELLGDNEYGRRAAEMVNTGVKPLSRRAESLFEDCCGVEPVEIMGMEPLSRWA